MAEQQGPICISVINMKGGVGKTTVAAFLARHAAQAMNLNVLAVDLDPQANLSQALMGAKPYKVFLNDKKPSIFELFNGYQPPHGNNASPLTLGPNSVIHDSDTRNLRLIPSRFAFSDSLSKAIGDERTLARFIANDCQNIDLVIIDCAPTESIFTRVAYHASRYVLVPVRPEFLATIGFPLLNDSLQDFRGRNRSHAIDVLGVVINYPNYEIGAEERLSLPDIKAEATTNSWPIFKNELRHRKGFLRMMRGDRRYSRNAREMFAAFASEFFAMPELSSLQSKRSQGGGTP